MNENHKQPPGIGANQFRDFLFRSIRVIMISTNDVPATKMLTYFDEACRILENKLDGDIRIEVEA